MSEQTGQRVSVVVFVSAAVAFFYFGGEMLARHTAWAEFQTPAGVGDICGLFASVGVVVAAALKIDIGGLKGLFVKE